MRFLGDWRSKLSQANESLATAHKSWRDEKLTNREQRADERERSLSQQQDALAEQLAALRAIEGRRWRRRLGLVVIATGTGAVGFIAGITLASAPVSSDQQITEHSEDNAGAVTTPATSEAMAETPASASKYPLEKQYAWIEVSKEAIKAQLKDAASAEFKDVRFYSGGGVPVACGQVNAKNGFGGYGGFERFIAAGREMAVLESQSSDGIGPVWDKFCTQGPDDQAHTD